MKNKIFNIIAASLALLGASSCNESAWDDLKSSGQGELQLSSLNIQINDNEKVITRADIDVSNYLVSVTDASGKSMGEWTYGKMPEVLTLPAGDNYKVKVESHAIQLAEWENPYYFGEQTFNIKKGEITQVEEIVAKFSSLRVSIVFHDDLKNKMGDDAKVTVKGTNNSELTFSKNETRSGYFALDESTTFAAHFTGTVDGVMTEQYTPFKDVKKGEHHKLTYKIQNGPEIPEPSGDIDTPGITLEVEYTEESVDGNTNVNEDLLDSSDRPGKEEQPEDPNQPGGDEPENPDEQPITFETLNAKEFTIKGVNHLTEESAPSFGEAIVVIKSQAGIKQFNVEISSTDKDVFESAIESLGLKSFELTEPDPEVEASLDNLSLPYGDEVKNQNLVNFNISAFIEMLSHFPGTHTFQMIVKDNNNETRSLDIIFEVTE